MAKWLKRILALLVILLLTAFVLYQIYLTPQFVNEPNLSSSLQTATLTLDGNDRTFHWYAPKQINELNTILYVLHGSRSSGLDIRQSMAYEFDQVADEEGVVVVYPTGFENHWNDCRASADYSANTENIDDFKFLKNVTSHLENELSLKFKYRFATGHSNGGHMCYRLALEHPEWINGIAPISANLPIDDNLDCGKSGKFTPICLINGTADKVNPYDGGLVEIMGNASRGTVLSTDETMAYWIGLANCSSPQIKDLPDKATTDYSSVRQTIWVCDSIRHSIKYEIIDGGHTIPHPKSKFPKILGTTNQDLNAPRAIWAFFKELRD